MNLTTGSLRAAFHAVCSRDGADVAGLPVAELLALADDAATLRREADLLLAQVAGEIERRSHPDDARAGLARRQGFRSAGELVARATGGSVAEANRLVTAGLLLSEGEHSDAETGRGPSDAAAQECHVTPIGEFRANLAREVRESRVSVEVAALFASALAGLPDADRTRDLFSRALAKAPGLPLHQVRKLVWQAQAFADPAAWEAREAVQHEQRHANLRDDADGMVTLTARLTPLAAAPVRAVLDANVRWAMQQRRDNPESDERTPGQMRADILVDLCKHALDCEEPTSGVKTTVVVRITSAELQNGTGVGEVDGVRQPVSVGALRRVAADAQVVPVVLGGASEVLDLGRARRLFTPAQRLALVERDGGCAWCNAPPSWCEAHHIRWWERDAGPTDLQNGVLLCTACHHRVHRDGWEITVREDGVRFVPPRGVNPARTAYVGGRARYDIAA